MSINSIRGHKIFPLAVIACCVILAAGRPVARAGYIEDIQEVGSDVVATGSGSINTAAFTGPATTGEQSTLNPSTGLAIVGGPPLGSGANIYFGSVAGPGSFGSGGGVFPTTSSGDLVGIADPSSVIVPVGYVSGSSLSSTSTFAGETLSALGITPGTYTWTWGAGATLDSYTLVATTKLTSRLTAVASTGTTPIPGGTGNFTALPSGPSYSGGATAFYGAGAGGQQGIYAFPPPPMAYRVADLDTAIPGGIGNFTDFTVNAFPPVPCISGGNVAFFGLGGGGQQGIYEEYPPTSIDPSGPVKVADLNTAIPGGIGNFTAFWPPNPIRPPTPSISGQNVAFFGMGGGGQQGIYAAFTPSPGFPPVPITVADMNTAIPGGSGNFTSFLWPPQPVYPPHPAISGQNVAFFGAGAGGQQGIYFSAFPPNPITPPTPITVADLNTAIPGGTGNFTGFFPLTPINGWPPNPCVSGQNVAFFGTGSGGQAGIYEAMYPPHPVFPPTPIKVADMTTPIPGGTGDFTDFGALSMSATDLVFLGDGSGGQMGIYDMTGGNLLKVVDLNSQLVPGLSITRLMLSPSAADGDPIAFEATFSDGSQELFLASVPEPSALVHVALGLLLVTAGCAFRRCSLKAGTSAKA